MSLVIVRISVTVLACCMYVLVEVMAGPVTVRVIQTVEYFVILWAVAVEIEVILGPGRVVVS